MVKNRKLRFCSNCGVIFIPNKDSMVCTKCNCDQTYLVNEDSY